MIKFNLLLELLPEKPQCCGCDYIFKFGDSWTIEIPSYRMLCKNCPVKHLKITENTITVLSRKLAKASAKTMEKLIIKSLE